MLYLRNYAVLNVKDQLAKIPGVGSVQLSGRRLRHAHLAQPAKMPNAGYGERSRGAMRRQMCKLQPAIAVSYDEGVELQLRSTRRDGSPTPIILRDHHQARRVWSASEGRGAIESTPRPMASLASRQQPAVAIPSPSPARTRSRFPIRFAPR